LKEKLPSLYLPEQRPLAGLESPHQEIIEALQALGYSNAEAAAAVNKAMALGEGDLTGEELLRKALNLVAGGPGTGR
jgi:Holliday junction resolvasome RuvABC DNA-binding subunit